MKKWQTLGLMASVALSLFLFQCAQAPAESKQESTPAKPTASFGGYASAELYGEHLVTICGCNDCHTPKKMTERGPEPDSSLWLSGHPSTMPAPAVDRADMAKRGLAVTDMLTAWVGPGAQRMHPTSPVMKRVSACGVNSSSSPAFVKGN